MSTVPSPSFSNAAVTSPPVNVTVVCLSSGLLVGGMWWLQSTFSWRVGVLLLLGGALGLVLYHALFGFTSAWREFVTERRGDGLRAQMLMLSVATVLFLPALAEGTLFGRSIVGAVAPISVSLMAGAFVFGLGMQLGGGCGSGTLYTTGSGNVRMLITLVAFMVGSVVGTAHVPWWFTTPSLGSVSLLSRYGIGLALVFQLTVFAGIAACSWYLEHRRHGRILAARPSPHRGWARLTRGTWPLLWGAVGLAALNWATLAIAGHPWGITYGYTLWGAKIGQALGVDIGSWEYWTWPYHRNALAASVFENTTSTMNFGILIGALLAAGLAGRFAPTVRIPWRSTLAAVLGGLMMGYGARLAFGCNIGAYFGGVASASLHGWAWFAMAMIGTVIGARLRPWFRL